ncbi:glycerophosphodiester phosphodiesterase family protein [Pseudotabrizicola formosa]|uniref:glycerophosphodiester phosphodiesterase family protein n=1 Tax=Pseudotabrizicola formosa TaxID=2030009 RepID=UPI000CD2E133|nr:glycerophosphodiester phosphodiesterase family protein [Pseudotabrizicola formosa]
MKFHVLAAALIAAFALPGPGAAATLNTLDGQAPIVIAHRGTAGYLPEHTLGGYELAIKMGADYIEPDLALTKDGVLVAMHDSTLRGTTDVATVFPGREFDPVRNFTYAEIQQLTVKPRGQQAGTSYPGFTPSMDNPYRVPTFQEVLDFLVEYNTANGTEIGIYPEAKSPTSAFGSRQIVQQLNAAGFNSANDKVFIQSFDLAALRAIAAIQEEEDSSQRLAALGSVSLLVTGEYSIGGMTLAEIATFADGVGVSLSGQALTKGFVDAAHALGLIVHGYTLRPLDQEASDVQIAGLFALGYDGWFTDYTDRTRASLDAILPPSPVPLPAGGLLLLGALGTLAFARRKAARLAA